MAGIQSGKGRSRLGTIHQHNGHTDSHLAIANARWRHFGAAITTLALARDGRGIFRLTCR